MEDKTRAELLEQIEFLKKRMAELEISDSERNQQQDNVRRLATVVRDSNDAITIQDFEGRITAWNRGAELIYGYKEKEALGMNMERLALPGKAAEHKELTRRLMTGEAVTSFETRRVAKDGRILDVWLTVTKVVDDAGKPIGIASTERDITERNKAKEEIRHLNRVFMALRGVNQLITREKNPDTLIAGTCRHLAENGGYANIWISLFDEKGDLKGFASDKPEGDFPGVKKTLEDGKRLKCQEMALAKNGVVVIEDASSACGDCPMSKEYEGRAVFCSRLAREGRVYGTVSVSLPEILARNKEEQGLFAELAGDLSYAFSVVETEEKQKTMQEEKEKHLKELEIFYKASSGREERILELKKEIGDLSKRLNEKS